MADAFAEGAVFRQRVEHLARGHAARARRDRDPRVGVDNAPRTVGLGRDFETVGADAKAVETVRGRERVIAIERMLAHEEHIITDAQVAVALGEKGIGQGLIIDHARTGTGRA